MLYHRTVSATFCFLIDYQQFALPSSPSSPTLHLGLKMTHKRCSATQLVTINEYLESVKPWRKGPGREFLRQSKNNWGGDGDTSLEAKILEFMEGSKNPQAFPTKKQLIDAGRMDLVTGILREGGWLASGWDLEPEIRDIGHINGSSSEELSSSSSSSHNLPASREKTPQELGVEGILNRLESSRKETYGFIAKERNMVGAASNYGAASSLAVKKGEDTWRAWSLQRAGDATLEFEDGVIDYEQNLQTPSINNDDIRIRLRDLQTELSSVLQTLKSDPHEFNTSSDELLKLSDAWEFRENEINSARDKLRSIRAKLAVMEGKMSLAINDSQKLLAVKQKKLDDARRALNLLRNVYIVWPNSASEVLVAGSFDGWVSKRRMERSRSGVFSLYLKLYPGRYEIKFIVDGEWKIDPLRPVVREKGYENNLLVIS